MDDTLRIVIHKRRMIFDDIIVGNNFVHSSKNHQKELGSTVPGNDIKNNSNRKLIPLNKSGFNSYLVSAYITTIKISEPYRRIALRALFKFITPESLSLCSIPIILMKLRTPRKQFLDYKWAQKIAYMIEERRQLDYAMSWLSTLGGAFSALGDQFQHCAQMAGKISAKQFQLALRLGDPFLVARCNLYTALSLIQQGDLRASKHMVKRVYRFAICKKDVRLQNMCHGVWAKLKYSHAIRHRGK